MKKSLMCQLENEIYRTIGINTSTEKVVDFRAKENLCDAGLF